MFFPGKIKKWLPVIAPCLVLLILTAVFFLRSPVLIVTDSSFEQIYGSGRLRSRNNRTSLELFRRVISVVVFENAGPDLVALAVVNTSPSPRAVLFPYRYMEGALYYTEMFPETPVFVMCGRNPPPEQPLTFVQTDTSADLYRAGMYAARLAGEKRVLVVSSGTIHEEQEQAFLTGVLKQGFPEDVSFLNVFDVFESFEETGCIVAIGSAGRFITQDTSIPVILFSWADPSLTPESVKLIFDDSPWALAKEALRKERQSLSEIFVPSRPLLLAGRMERKINFFGHSALLRDKLQKNQ